MATAYCNAHTLTESLPKFLWRMNGRPCVTAGEGRMATLAAAETAGAPPPLLEESGVTLGDMSSGRGELARKEVEDLHVFFQSWFAGSLQPQAFERVEAALDRDFTLVSPRASVERRPALLVSIRAAHGKRPQFRIWIEEFAVLWERDAFLMVRYHELQQDGDEARTARLSTALFRADEQTANRLVWMHVHETWLSAAASGR